MRIALVKSEHISDYENAHRREYSDGIIRPQHKSEHKSERGGEHSVSIVRSNRNEHSSVST